jgi:hypothetical protein
MGIGGREGEGEANRGSGFFQLAHFAFGGLSYNGEPGGFPRWPRCWAGAFSGIWRKT